MAPQLGEIPASRRYGLGLRLVELAQGVSPRLGLREATYPEPERLAALVGETAKLSAPDQDERFCIDAVEGREQMRMIGQVGMRNPFYAGAASAASGRRALTLVHLDNSYEGGIPGDALANDPGPRPTAGALAPALARQP